MKKKIFLIITCLLLTGCTANYNLEITDNNFHETISGNILNDEIELDNSKTDIGHYEYLLNAEQPIFQNNDTIFYNKTINKKENSTDFEYSYTFNETNFNNSRTLNTCFDNYSFESKDNKYNIYLSGNFHCAYTDKININLTTDYTVTAHNADKKSKNTYTWTINKNEIEDLNLYITIDKEKTKASNILNWSTFKTIGLITLLILSGIAIFIGKKKLKD